ncbi:MAG: hypothetical protein WC565_06405 [Parcubacteria group bacterium]
MTLSVTEQTIRDLAEIRAASPEDKAAVTAFVLRVCEIADQRINVGCGGGYTGKLYCIDCPDYPHGCASAATPERMASFEQHIAELRRRNVRHARQNQRIEHRRATNDGAMNEMRRTIG